MPLFDFTKRPKREKPPDWVAVLSETLGDWIVLFGKVPPTDRMKRQAEKLQSNVMVAYLKESKELKQLAEMDVRLDES